MKYRYFVSYSYCKGEISGFGSVDILRQDPITSYDHIIGIAKSIEEKYGYDVVIVLNYIRLGAEENIGDSTQ